MSALTLPAMPPEMSSFDRALYLAIVEAAEPSGVARSLFDLAERRAGLCYRHACRRLSVLEALNLITVRRAGRGRALAIRLC